MYCPIYHSHIYFLYYYTKLHQNWHNLKVKVTDWNKHTTVASFQQTIDSRSADTPVTNLEGNTETVTQSAALSSLALSCWKTRTVHRYGWEKQNENDHAKFERSCLNSLWENVHVIVFFPGRKLFSLDYIQKSHTRVTSKIFSRKYNV